MFVRMYLALGAVVCFLMVPVLYAMLRAFRPGETPVRTAVAIPALLFALYAYGVLS